MQNNPTAERQPDTLDEKLCQLAGLMSPLSVDATNTVMDATSGTSAEVKEKCMSLAASLAHEAVRMCEGREVQS